MLKEFENDTRIVHCNSEPYDIYIGRPSMYGNPFTHIKGKKTKAEFIVKNADEALEKYEQWIVSQPVLMNSLHELRGKTLGCWCKDKHGNGKCHGDVIIKLLNKDI